MKKTNVMRYLDSKKLVYDILTYDASHGAVDGVTVAQAVDRDISMVFKTLVVESQKNYYVCMIPVEDHLSLKKVAKACGEKKVEMIPVKDLLKVTGYVRGGCSPLGMKKVFPLYIHESISQLDKIVFSAGKIGYQIEMKAEELLFITKGTIIDLIET